MTQETLVFGPFRLDLRNEQLWRGETALPLKAKTFAVLRYLVAHAGELATKDAIFAAVWPETAVSDSVLTVAIRQLRQVLGDRARQPQYIETAHGRGYRFIAPVAEAPPSATPLSPTVRVATAGYLRGASARTRCRTDVVCRRRNPAHAGWALSLANPALARHP